MEEYMVAEETYILKHPLENEWTMWYFQNDKKLSWENNQMEVATFNTVEDFWSVFDYIKRASALKSGTDYSLFKKGIKPMWEDPANNKGGKWLISLDRGQMRDYIDRYWLDVVLCLIGEIFEDFNQSICGAVVNKRPKADKIAVWTSDATERDTIMKIGKKLKEQVDGLKNITIVYEFHKDWMDKQGSTTKYTYSC